MIGTALVDLLNIVFEIFDLLILARIIMSWLNPDPYNPIVQFLHNITEPFLAPVRRRLPPTGMFDLSPIVVLIVALVLRQILIQLVISLFL